MPALSPGSVRCQQYPDLMQDWKENINTIKEIKSGHYQIILDFATTKILEHLLRDDYAYVWVINHQPPQYMEWTESVLPAFGATTDVKALSRKLTFDFALKTSDFRSILGQLGTGVTLVQLNTLPAYYVDVERMKGSTLFDILRKECDYLFYPDLPMATDYGTLISSNRDYLQSILGDPFLNWNDLP